MPFFYTRLTNSSFQTRDDGQEFDTADAALTEGVISALDIAADEFRRARTSTAVEVRIEGFDEVPVRKAVMSMSVADIRVG